MKFLLGLTAAPLLVLFVQVSSADVYNVDWSSVGQTMKFAVGTAAIATIIGCGLGILFGTREFLGRRAFFVTTIVLIAAPPAFWWIGITRLTTEFSSRAGIASAALAGAMALSPITMLLVVAAIRQMPSNLYEAARVVFPPITRLRAVLLPLLIPAVTGGFVLSVILSLGESELPFLLGFRTLMTDVVTTFSQTFDVRRTLPLMIPLILAILAMGIVSAKPLTTILLASTRGAHGIVRRPGSGLLSICAAIPPVYIVASLIGYGYPVWISVGGRHASFDLEAVAASVTEPVASAWIALALTVMCAYPARRARVMPYLVWIALLLFCIPAAIYAMGWIHFSQIFGGLAVPPIVAHVSRAVALCVLGFAVGYARLPESLENAARLVKMSAAQRAIRFVLPLIAGSLMASASLAGALAYADRDVASLLLAPGASRLTLNFYLASANAPSATVGVLAFAVLLGAALTIILAGAVPALLWRWRV